MTNSGVSDYEIPSQISSGRGRVYSVNSFAVPGTGRRQSKPAPWQRRYLWGIVSTDILAGMLGAVAGFVTRFGDFSDHSRIYALGVVALPILWIALLGMSRAFETRYLFVGTDEYQRVVRGFLAIIAVVAVVSYALEIPTSRIFVVISIPTTALLTIVFRFCWRKWLHGERAKGNCLKRVLVVGHELPTAELVAQLSRERYHGLKVVAACVPDGEARGSLLDFHIRVCGGFERIAGAVEEVDADVVLVLTSPEFDGTRLRRLSWDLERCDTELIVASAMVDIGGERTSIRPVDGLPMLHLDHVRLTGVRRWLKECTDRVGAALLITFLSPVFLVTIALIRLTSSGAAFYCQERIGRDGKPFTIWKFRSMYLDASRRLAQLQEQNESDGVLFKMREDPRVTPVGTYLRRLSIDELPQLFNVLKGDMSLVGPRPPLPTEVAAYSPDVRRRLVVKPGMTGLWQVSGRSDLSWDEAVRLDLRYVENWTLSLDFVIMLRTVTAVMRSRGAY
ncbi:sugar transferase [Haloglycomyces albus]|uniref:sugar transferase n=1 Tax=Haloglycomyces albus TaxID=526067 RepID=UPI0004B34501|nr:sugar transferase [Haloglycomyces albus]